jgi:hypothetical protein
MIFVSAGFRVFAHTRHLGFWIPIQPKNTIPIRRTGLNHLSELFTMADLVVYGLECFSVEAVGLKILGQ